MPGVVVGGVGAVAEPPIPVGVVYQSKAVPLAVNGVAVAFWQYAIGLVAAGAAGVVFTVTVIAALGPSPQEVVWLT